MPLRPTYGYMHRIHYPSGRSSGQWALRLTVAGPVPRIVAIVEQPKARNEPQWDRKNEEAFQAYCRTVCLGAANLNQLAYQAIHWEWDRPPKQYPNRWTFWKKG